MPYCIMKYTMSEQDNDSTTDPLDAATEITDTMMSSLADVVKNVISIPDNATTDADSDSDIHISEEISDSSSLDVETLINHGEAAHRTGDHTSALDCFNKAIALDPSNAMAWFNRGVLLEAEQDMKGAKQSFVICLDLDSEHGPALANLAVLLDRLGDIDGAVEVAMKSLNFFPGHPHLLKIVEQNKAAGAKINPNSVVMPQTKQRMVDQRLQPAVDASNKSEVVHENSFDSENENQVVESQNNVETPSDEIQSQQVASQEIAVDLDNLCERATGELGQGNARNALLLLKEYLHTDAAQHFDSWRISAGAMAAMGLDDHAIGAYNHAITLNPNHSKCYFNLGALHERKGNNEAAIDCFCKAIMHEPSYLKAAQRLLILAEESSNIEALLIARRNLSHDEEGKHSLALLLVELAEGEAKILDNLQGLPPTIPEGPALAMEAVDLCKDNTALKGRALSASGQHTEAVKCWKAIIQTDKSNPDNWIGLARALEAAGELETAERCHQKAAILREQGKEVERQVSPVMNEQPEVSQHEQVAMTMDHQAEVTDQTLSSDSETMSEIYGEQKEIETNEDTVDLAAAALEASTKMNSYSPMETNSRSIANQDIEWYNKGVGLIEDKKYREALSCFDRALPSFAGNDEMVIRILNGRGNALYYLEDYPKCVESYHKAMVINPKEVQGKTLYNMGTAYAEMQRFSDAIKCFEQAIPRGLKKDHQKLAKEQIRRCNILLKEQQRKLN